MSFLVFVQLCRPFCYLLYDIRSVISVLWILIIKRYFGDVLFRNTSFEFYLNLVAIPESKDRFLRTGTDIP